MLVPAAASGIRHAPVMAVVTVRNRLMAMRHIMEIAMMMIGVMLHNSARAAVMGIHIMRNTAEIAIAFSVIIIANILIAIGFILSKNTPEPIGPLLLAVVPILTIL